jgi:rod shape determining protein RodA
MGIKVSSFKKLDWLLVLSLLPLFFTGLITMKSFGPVDSGSAGDYFFWRQLIWIAIGFVIFLWLSFSDLRWLFSSLALVVLYLFAVISLILLLWFNNPVRGAASWFKLGLFSFDPSEIAKIVLILILAKYFSRRHIEIANVKHIVISGLYAVLPAILIFLQPDFGSSLILGAIWFGMVMASGISKKHFFILAFSAAAVLAVCWFFILAPYQRLRIYSFINPYLDPRGSGYHIIQTTIAVGAGGVWGRGIGLGSQSRLEFLPEHRTDFIFAAIGEELGFVGIMFLIIFFILLIFRIIKMAAAGNENFVRLYATGLAILLISQFLVHTGMNVGLLPITGLPLPFVSYGGSSLITFFASLGILMSMRVKSFLPRHIQR